MKKVLLSILAVVSVVALAITGTVAYLQSEDEDVNVMTLGNVKIEQVEYERDENGNLVDFTQAKPAYPAVGAIAWANEGVEVNGVEYKVFSEDLKNVVDKIVTVNNTGKSDAYLRTLVAIEAPEGDPNDLIHVNYNSTGVTLEAAFLVDIDDVTYYVMPFVYNEALAAGAKSAPSLMQVFLDAKTTNEDCAKFGDVWDIKVISQAVQTKGFDNAATALNTAFGTPSEKAAEWFGALEVPAVVDNAEELREAMVNGGEIILAKDIEDFDANVTVTVPAGKSVTLNLNGHKISATADKTGNQELFLVKGTMTVKNGTLELTAENNQGWNSMATIFDVTAGGVLKVDGVTASVSGTDMNFFVHLNNWGSATLEMTNCDITTTYVAVRAFNSGNDMNTVTIQDSNFYTGRMFWVHNYTSEGKDGSTLNLDIYGNNNTCNNAKPVRFGFSNEVYYDMNGILIP